MGQEVPWGNPELHLHSSVPQPLPRDTQTEHIEVSLLVPLQPQADLPAPSRRFAQLPKAQRSFHSHH